MKTAQEAGLSPIPVSREALRSLVAGEHHDPHSVLGAHPSGDPAHPSVTIRTLRPLADRVTALVGTDRYELEHEHEGVFVGVVPGPHAPDYRLEVVHDGT